MLQVIKKYILLVKLNPHIKQFRMYRNSKEINLAKPETHNSRIIITEHVSGLSRALFSTTFLEMLYIDLSEFIKKKKVPRAISSAF